MTRQTFGVLFACFLTVLIAYSIRYSYGALLPEMLPDLLINKAQAGIIYSSYFVAYTALSPILGLMSDRFNLRVLIALFVVIMGAGTFLMQFATSVFQASIYFTIAGIGCAACWAPVMALAQRWVSDKRRGMSLAMIDAGSSLGVMAAGALIPLIVGAANWESGWFYLGVTAIFFGFLNFLLIRNHPHSLERREYNDVSANIQRQKTALTYGQILQDPRFWLIGIAYLLTGFAIIIPFVFLSTYAVQELDYPYGSATLLVTTIGAGGIIGKLTLGPLSDKVGRAGMMILSAFLIGAGCLAMVFSRGWMLSFICFVYGVGYGACWALYAACASDYFSKQSAGGIIGLWTLLMGLGSIMAPVLSGWLADTTGTLTWTFILAMTAGFLSLFLLVIMWRMSRPILCVK